MLTIASAQAKFILSGEHFVVEGAPGVVIPAPCFYTQVSLSDQTGGEITAECVFDLDLGISKEKKQEYEAVVIRLIQMAGDLLCINLQGIRMSGVGLRCVVKSTIPPGQGAGSSSALCQAIIEAMLKHFYTNDVHPNYLKWFGTQLENAWHGPVSGVDNAAIAYRRMMMYQREKAPEPLEPACPMFFVVGSPGLRVQNIPYKGMRYCRENQPVQYAAYRRVSSENAQKMASAIREGDIISMGALMRESHELFNALGIVTPKMNQAVEEACRQHAFGARMTGAGGGGFVIACVPIQGIEPLQSAWRNMGLSSVRSLTFGLETLG